VLGPFLFLATYFALSPAARGEQPAETFIRLTVDATPAPKPALRYRLLPGLDELTPGNPIPNYLKCFFDQDFSSREETLSREALKLADRAARMDKPDWQLLPRLKTDGIGLLLPDLQKMRSIASSLQVRFKEEAAARRFDDALVTARTMFALSRHMSEHPTIIGHLVAVAIAYVTIAPLEEMLEQPGCPNLYWALAALPRPFAPMGPGIEGERVLMDGEFKNMLHKIVGDDEAPMTPQQVMAIVRRFERLLEFDSSQPGNISGREYVMTRAKDPKFMAAARKRLVEAGLSEAKLNSFPPEQIVLLDEKREFQARRDELFKLTYLPCWQAVKEAAKFERKMKANRAPLDGLLPSIRFIKVHGRLDQRLALLQCVEALRMYAADHGGALPEKLEDVGVPLPADPFTGKPFLYKLEGATAHVRGTPPEGETQAAYNIHYEITIRK
jgi:hypothetical protein